jgi:hypothetical protein
LIGQTTYPNNISKNEVKPALWAWNITCRIMLSTRHVIYRVAAVSFTSSSNLLWCLIWQTTYPKMRWNQHCKHER